MAIIGTLLSIAVPRYFHALAHARETVLRQDLTIMREALDKYYADLGQYPDELARLAERRYLRAVPADPFTKQSATWVLVQSEDPEHEGIVDVHSGATDLASDGTPVASW